MHPARSAPTLVVVGAGIFGLTAALELRGRGWEVVVIDRGAVPSPEAASTDVSKVIRMDYGADAFHTELGEAAMRGWDEWNRRWPAPLYHEDGFLLMSREPMMAGGFEHESFSVLRGRGHAVERIDAAALRARFPEWAPDVYVDGYFNPRAGWAESGLVLAQVAHAARAAGVAVEEGSRFARLVEDGSRVAGIQTTDGRALHADVVLIAAGAWTPAVLPYLAGVMRTTGQPVVHFDAGLDERWRPPRFPVWAADIARTGWYGFPALPDGSLKVGHHGTGRPVHADDARVVQPAEIARARAFLAESLPALRDAPVRHARLCLYCDTFDGDFWIDHDPDRPGLVVAAGDSGHGFKFAPVLGSVIADVVERRPSPWAHRFRWRAREHDRREAARAAT